LKDVAYHQQCQEEALCQIVSGEKEVDVLKLRLNKSL